MRHIAIYVRVSTAAQDQRSQLPDLRRWVAAYADGQPVKWYQDKASGKSMDRPGWHKLTEAMRAGSVSRVVCWRLDRLGRTASGLTTLFDELHHRKVGLVSVRDGVDLATPAGRLMANVIASVACYENEVRSERIVAGQAAARAEGKQWGGSKQGRRIKVSDEQVETVLRLHSEGGKSGKVAAIARATGLSRPSVYAVLAEQNGSGPRSR